LRWRRERLRGADVRLGRDVPFRDAHPDRRPDVEPSFVLVRVEPAKRPRIDAEEQEPADGGPPPRHDERVPARRLDPRVAEKAGTPAPESSPRDLLHPPRVRQAPVDEERRR